MRGDWGARGQAPPALPVGSPAARLPEPRPPGTGSAGSSGAGMTAALPAGAAAEQGGGLGRGGRGEEKEEEEQRPPRPRRGERLGEGHRAPPGTLSMEPTIRRALGRGQGPGAGALPRPPAPPTSGTHPLVGRVRRAVAQRGPRWRPWRGVGGRLLPGPLSVPSLERWGGPRPGELAPSAGAGTGEEVGAWERGVLRRGAREGSGDGAPGEGAACPRSGVEFLLSCFLQMRLGMFSGEPGYCPACLSLSTPTLLQPTPPEPPAPQPALSRIPPKSLPFLPQGGSLALWPPHRPEPVGA